MTTPNDDARIRRLVRQQLMSLRGFGISEWPRPEGKYPFESISRIDSKSDSAAEGKTNGKRQVHQQPTMPATPESTPAARIEEPPARFAKPTKPKAPVVGAPSEQVTEHYPEPKPVDERVGRLEVLRETVASCTRCPKLCERRTQTVFGVGNVQPRLVFLGEAPGEDEDKQGEPFVGRAGQLLTKIIQAMKLTRDDVYILNTVKCRPPMNRNPAEDELENCWEYLVEQLDILQPEIICCLGSIAMRRLLSTNQSIGRLRGRFFRYKESKVLVTYHPSYLLRMEGQTVRGISPKRMVWDDMKLILAELGLPVP